MTEYWLQKKTLGGWSHVTWYATEAEAIGNLNRATAGDSGYSWRVVKAETIAEKLLVDHEEPTKPEWSNEPAKSNVWAGQNNKNLGWGATPGPTWGNGFKPDNPRPVAPPSGEHPLAGMVWLINHQEKTKVRVKPNEVQRYLDSGYERGGPKTKFRE